MLAQDSLDAYVHNGGLASHLGGAVSADTIVIRAAYVKTLASTQTEHLDRFRSAAAQAKSAAAALLIAHQQAARSAAQLESARQATLASQQQQQSTLGQVKGDIAAQVAQLEAAKQAAATIQAQQRLAQLQAPPKLAVAAAAGAIARTATAAPAPLQIPLQTPLSPITASAPPPTTPRPPAPVGSGGAAAVTAAKSRLGLPYVWGAAGPDSFDCSGLTMWAWAHAGVSLPHFSGAQYASTTHISLADLQPGDLVFFADTGAHVAMYIGGGQIIAAPHSGTVVQIQPLWSGYVYASRR